MLYVVSLFVSLAARYFTMSTVKVQSLIKQLQINKIKFSTPNRSNLRRWYIYLGTYKIYCFISNVRFYALRNSLITKLFIKTCAIR